MAKAKRTQKLKGKRADVKGLPGGKGRAQPRKAKARRR